MSEHSEELWIPLVDEPIGSIVKQIERDDPELLAKVDTPRRLLAFRTFAYIRVGLLLGQLLVEHDLEPYNGTETWVEALMRDPAHSARVRAEVTAVADEIAADPKYAGDERLGPDEATRERFKALVREKLG